MNNILVYNSDEIVIIWQVQCWMAVSFLSDIYSGLYFAKRKRSFSVDGETVMVFHCLLGSDHDAS